MNDSPRFDEARSAAIRAALIDVVEQSPRHDRRRQVRVALAAVLAAIGIGLGGTAVAFAVSGDSLFGSAPETPIAAAPTSEPTTPSPSPAPTTTPNTPAPHPLVVTDGVVTPHDVLTAPAATPLWSVPLPGVHDKCEPTQVIDVSDGYALFQTGPTTQPEDSNFDCALDASRFSLTLVDTSTGSALWNREWSWPYHYSDATSARLLGTSGKVLVWDGFGGPGPKEVLDLATGATTATITTPTGYDLGDVYPVPGDSGDVTFVAQKLDAAGAPTPSWTVERADPQNLAEPRWSVAFDAESATTLPIRNSSSILQVARQPSGNLDVYDVDSGALMVGDATDRGYDYYDGVTLRYTGRTDFQTVRTVSGVDDAGNEIWSRTLDSGYVVAPVQPGFRDTGMASASELLLIGPGAQVELVDGATGESRWTADGSACHGSAATGGPAVDPYGFLLEAGDVIVQAGGDVTTCGFDHATGAIVDLSQRPVAWKGTQGALAQYTLQGGLGTGGLYTDRTETTPPTPMPQSGTGTALDQQTGAPLWTIPIYYDERWAFAGGYLVGFTQGTVFGIG